MLYRFVVAFVSWGCTLAFTSPSFDKFIYDPYGNISNIHLLLDAELDFFSTDFVEKCSNSSSYLHTHGFEYSQFRQELNSVALPGRIYQGPCPPTVDNAQAYLKSPISGFVYNRSYPYTCHTTDNIPDDSLSVVAHSRLQTCVFGIRLVPPSPGKIGAVFYKYKQQVAYGFSSLFSFSFYHSSVFCPVASEETLKFPGSGPPRWCYRQGGKGFAFVIQNYKKPASLQDDIKNGGEMGFSFPENLAIEIDLFKDESLNDPNWVHVAVFVPWSQNSSNSANHNKNMLAEASTDFLGDLTEGVHAMEVTYEVHSESEAWEKLFGGKWDNEGLLSLETNGGLGRASQVLMDWENGRIGTLSVLIDGIPVLKTLVDLARVLSVDSVSAAGGEGNEVDESLPGGAWIGFVGATGDDVNQITAPTILSWKFTPVERCPGGDDSDITCTSGKSAGVSTGTGNYSLFSLQNIARVPIQVSFKSSSSSSKTDGVDCTNNLLQWDQVHPYFLGCKKRVNLSSDIVDELWITDSENVRSVRVIDPFVIAGGSLEDTRRRSLFEYCVIEHKYDPYRLYFAQCNCEYCSRAFHLQNLYSVFFSGVCTERFGTACDCFEVSQMTWTSLDTSWNVSSNPWRVLKPAGGLSVGQPLMSFQRHSLCRGCKYDSHCNFMYKAASCNTPKRKQRIGNPLAPKVFDNPHFVDWSRDEGRVVDGLIQGDTCNCFDYDGELNTYVNTQGVMQRNEIYLLRTLQKTRDECLACLALFDGAYCAVECGPATSVTYLSWPAGQSCATCSFAGPVMNELSYQDRTALINCYYDAVKDGNDPWLACDALSKSLAPLYSGTKALFNGVVTHYLTECPGRTFTEFGAVCAPNVVASSSLPMQVLSRFGALVDQAWSSDFMCINAACDLSPLSNCYEKLVKFVFTSGACSDLIGSGLSCHFENSPLIENSTIHFNKSLHQWGYSDRLPSAWGALREKTLEVWAVIDPSEEVHDLSISNADSASSSSEWGEDYVPFKAVDGNLDSFWSSVVSVSADFVSVYVIDFERLVYVEGVNIYWQNMASDFHLEYASEGDWILLESFTGNFLDFSFSRISFSGTRFRVVMTKAATARGPGPSEGFYVYAIRELEIISDRVISRLKPVRFVNNWDYPVNMIADGDSSTWWSAEKGIDFASLFVDFGSVLDEVVLLVLKFRKGLVPGMVSYWISSGSLASSDFRKITCSAGILCDTSQVYGDITMISLDLADGSISSTNFRSLRIDLSVPPSYFDSAILQMAEVEIYSYNSSDLNLFVSLVSTSTCLLSTGVSCYTSLSNFLLGSSSVFQADVGTVINFWGFSSLRDAGNILGRIAISYESGHSYQNDVLIESVNSSFLFQKFPGVSKPFSFFDSEDFDGLRISFLSNAGSLIGSTLRINSLALKGLSTNLVRTESVTFAASNSWVGISETGSGNTVYQGKLEFATDGNLSTEYRLPLGERTPLVLFSSKVVSFSFDVLRLYFSLAPDFVELWGKHNNSQILLFNSSVGQNLSLVGISRYKFPLLLDELAGVHALNDFVSLVFPTASDRYGSENLIGIREVEFFDFNEKIDEFSTIPVSAYNSVVDGNLSTFWSGSLVGDSLQMKLDSCEWLESVIVRFSDKVAEGSLRYFTFTVSDTSDCTDPMLTDVLSTSQMELSIKLATVVNSCIWCMRFAFAGGNKIKIAEIEPRKVTAAFRSPYVTSTLLNPSYALDGLPETAATSSDLISNHSLNISLTNFQEVWGFNVTFSNLKFPEQISIFLCGDMAAIILSGCSAWRNVFEISSNNKSSLTIILMESYTSRYVSLSFALPGNSSSEITGFSLTDFQVFSTKRLSAIQPASQSGEWNYPVSNVVDGNSNSFFLSELDATSSQIFVEMGSNLSSPFFASNFSISFVFPPLSFQIFGSLNSIDWFPLTEFFNNFRNSTISMFLNVFVNYFRLDMTRRSFSIEDFFHQFPNLYGVRSLEVEMSTSLQISKSITAETQANSSKYSPLAAMDGDIESFWLHNPATLPAIAEYTMPRVMEISGFSFLWENVPVSYQLEYGNSSSPPVWTLLDRWDDLTSDSTSYSQTVADGFIGDRFRIFISEIKNFITAPVAVLRELSVFSPTYQCDFNSCPCCFDRVMASDITINPSLAFDGNLLTIWYTDSTSTATISTRLNGASIGKLQIHWNVPCKKFIVTIDTSSGERYEVLTSDNNSDLTLTMLLYYRVDVLTITMLQAWPGNGRFEIRDIFVWAGEDKVQPTGFVEDETQMFTSSIENAILPDADASFWMGDPGLVPGNILLDLGLVYKVRLIQVWWALRPTISDDDMYSISQDGNEFEVITMSIQKFDTTIEEFHQPVSIRFFRIQLAGAFQDQVHSPAKWSVAIRNIEISLNSNLAYLSPALVPAGSWNFAAPNAFDGNSDSFWMSKFGSSSAKLEMRFQKIWSIAGVSVEFVYRAGSMIVSKSTDCIEYQDIFSLTGNNEFFVNIPSTLHFTALCMKFIFELASDSIFDPLKPSDKNFKKSILGVRQITISEHTGGGGLFGIEECDDTTNQCGLIFDSIAYGLDEPRRWQVSSDMSARTSTVNGILESTGNLVQFAATFSNEKVTLYRNGIPYGSAYSYSTSESPGVSGSKHTRLVFGVRSSAFIGQSDVGQYTGELANVAGKATTLSAFFSGSIESATLIRGSLLPEEVLGLYHLKSGGGNERACHCADVCPVGVNRFFPEILVPCSGQGVCVSNSTELVRGGKCICSPGYSGEACQFHCSLIGGCCTIDDDCPLETSCNSEINTCVSQ